MLIIRVLIKGLLGWFYAATLLIAVAVLSKEGDPASKERLIASASALPGAHMFVGTASQRAADKSPKRIKVQIEQVQVMVPSE